jgi:hypothetical protein
VPSDGGPETMWIRRRLLKRWLFAYMAANPNFARVIDDAMTAKADVQIPRSSGTTISRGSRGSATSQGVGEWFGHAGSSACPRHASARVAGPGPAWRPRPPLSSARAPLGVPQRLELLGLDRPLGGRHDHRLTGSTANAATGMALPMLTCSPVGRRKRATHDLAYELRERSPATDGWA